MRLVTRESSKNEPRNELDSLVTRLVPSLHSMSALFAGTTVTVLDLPLDPVWAQCGGEVTAPAMLRAFGHTWSLATKIESARQERHLLQLTGCWVVQAGVTRGHEWCVMHPAVDLAGSPARQLLRMESASSAATTW